MLEPCVLGCNGISHRCMVFVCLFGLRILCRHHEMICQVAVSVTMKHVSVAPPEGVAAIQVSRNRHNVERLRNLPLRCFTNSSLP